MIDPALAQPAGAQPDRARAMRRVATGLLAAMAVLFALSHRLEPAQPLWGWVRAFSEAAMVGGFADWFAVTALFRHPLGLPIPHTAIVPANKDRIATTMAGFLRTNFLTVPVLGRRLAGLDVAAALGHFLTEPSPGNTGRSAPAPLAAKGLVGGLGDLLETLAGDRLGAVVTAAARTQLDKLDIATLGGNLLAAAVADGRHRPAIEALLRRAGILLEDNEHVLRALIRDRANAILRWTGLDERLANTILDGLYRLLAECIVNPDHPLRLRLEAGLAGLARDLVHDPALRARVELIKRGSLAHPATAAWLDTLWLRGRAAMLRAVRDPRGALSGRVGEVLAGFGQSLQTDAQLQWQVNRLARRVLAGVATRYGAAIVTLVSETVKRWDSGTVTRRIEGAVGRDLQFIRINGTLVGGLVGLVLHLLALLV